MRRVVIRINLWHSTELLDVPGRCVCCDRVLAYAGDLEGLWTIALVSVGRDGVGLPRIRPSIAVEDMEICSGEACEGWENDEMELAEETHDIGKREGGIGECVRVVALGQFVLGELVDG